jgi:hypothetical protein
LIEFVSSFATTRWLLHHVDGFFALGVGISNSKKKRAGFFVVGSVADGVRVTQVGEGGRTGDGGPFSPPFPALKAGVGHIIRVNYKATVIYC